MQRNRLAITALLWLLPTAVAFACSCGDKPSVKRAYEIYDFVAICEATEVIGTNEGEFYRPYQRDVILEVIEVFKGYDQEQIVDSSSGSNCTYMFRKGEKYLVYAKGSDGVIATTYCARTMPFSKVKQKELKKLRKLGGKK